MPYDTGMPPRFAYWTILIDNVPTAFRARDAQELLPTLNQLKRTNQSVVLKWFSGGQLWDSPEAARDARRRPKVFEKRGAGWRPGGQHQDPRARFARKKHHGAPVERGPREGGQREWREGGKPSGPRKPWGSKPGGGPRKPWGNKHAGGPRKPWSSKPGGGPRKPWENKPAGGPRKPWGGKPGGGGQRFAKPWRDRPQGGPPRGPQKPWRDRPPAGPPRGPKPDARTAGKRRDDEE